MSLQSHYHLAGLPDNEELSEYVLRRSSLGMVANGRFLRAGALQGLKVELSRHYLIELRYTGHYFPMVFCQSEEITMDDFDGFKRPSHEIATMATPTQASNWL